MCLFVCVLCVYKYIMRDNTNYSYLSLSPLLVLNFLYIQILCNSSLPSFSVYQNCAAVAAAAVTGGIDVLSIVVAVIPPAADVIPPPPTPAVAVAAPSIAVAPVPVPSCGSRGYQECLSVSSAQRDSKNFLMPCPALPTGESSSLNISQLSKICRTSTQKSSRHL